MRTILGIAMAGLMLAACGSVGTGGGPTPSTTPGGPHFDVSATEKDRAVILRTGQKLEVVLHAYASMNGWSQVRSSDETVLAPIVNPAATAVRGVTLAAFQALAPGVSTVTAFASPNCSPGQACPMYVAVYSLKVTVTA
jgi:hypothetical protein